MEKNSQKLIFEILGTKPISFNPLLARITGSITSALLLSQILYWWRTMGFKEFYKTNGDFSNELAMGINEFKSAKNKLKKFVQIKIKGVPAKTYYKPLEENIVKALFDLPEPPTSLVDFNQPVGAISTNQLAENQPTTTENTTENTQKENNTRFASLDILSLSEDQLKEIPDYLRVYRYFLIKFKKTPNTVKLTDTRKNKINARLKSFGLQEVIQAIKNCADSPFHRGENDRAWKANIDFIIRSDEQIEKLRDLVLKQKPKKVLVKFDDGTEAWVDADG